MLGVERDGWAKTTWQSGFTLLHWACHQGLRNWAEYFVRLGGDLNARDDRQRTPADCARNKGHLDLAEWATQGKAPLARTASSATAATSVPLSF